MNKVTQNFNSSVGSVSITGNGNIVNGLGGECVHGNGDMKREDRDVAEFTGIKIIGSVDAVHRTSTSPSLTIMADSNLINLITTEVINGELVISSVGSYSTSNKIVVECGSGLVNRIKIKGSGDVDLENVSSDTLDVIIKGTGDVDATGSVKALRVEIKGSGDVDLSELDCKTAVLVIKGSGDIRARVSDELDARILGSGDIKIKGNPSSTKVVENGTGRVKFK
jgi:hypothetical protein